MNYRPSPPVAERGRCKKGAVDVRHKFDGILDLLVGGFNPSEKYEFVNWDDDILNIWENNKCSKPPTSLYTVE